MSAIVTPGSMPASATITAPRVDRDAVAVGVAAVFVMPALCRGKHETAGLDGACAQQEVPVRFAGLLCEGSRHRDHFRTRLGQRAIERRKAHVVANGQSDLAERRRHDDRHVTRSIGVGLAIAFAVRRLTSNMWILS